MKPRADVKTITAWRNPTQWELKWGAGAKHYRDFELSEWLKPDGTLKRWIKWHFDGCRYYRG